MTIAFENFKNTEKKYLKTTHIPYFLQQAAATLGILVISPILFLVWLAIKLDSKGPAIYSQVRVGEHGKRFTVYKFRSMYTAEDPRYVDPKTLKSDREGACLKLFNDPRITRVGCFIRKFSLDELPQLFNIARGDMVLVGPRPALPCEVDVYYPTAMNRLNVKPGLTGLWQVSGRADTTFEEQVQLDNDYVYNRTVLLDCKIILMTVPAVLLAKGAY